MNISKITKFGIASLLAGFACGVAGADTNTDLQERLEVAEARIAELSTSQDSNWLNDTRADEIRSLVHERVNGFHLPVYRSTSLNLEMYLVQQSLLLRLQVVLEGLYSYQHRQHHKQILQVMKQYQTL